MTIEGYPYIQENKISLGKLLSCRLGSIPASAITNGLVVDLIRLSKVKRLQWKIVILWLEQLYGRKWPNPPPANLTITKTLITLFKKHRSLTIQHKLDEHANYMDTLFVLPSTKVSVAGKITKQISRPKRRSIIRREEFKAYNTALRGMGSELKSAVVEVDHLYNKIKSLQQKFQNIRKQSIRKEKSLELQKKRVVQLKADRKQIIKVWKRNVKEIKKAKDRMANQMETFKKSATRSKAKYKSRLRRMKNKKTVIIPKHDEDSDSNGDVSSDAVEDLNSSVHELEVKVDELQEQIQELRSEKLEVMEKGHFNHKIRECCMTMLAQNVGIRNVEKCIRAALELSNINVDRLPGKSTLANMAVEARSIAHLQMAEKIPGDMVNTLHSDGTTKFGEKFGGFQVTTPDSSYTLCLTEMKAGGARDFKEVLDNALSDMDQACQAVIHKPIANKILASLKNIMSDRHIVEKNFNQLLESYRSAVLPEVVSEWQELTLEQKNSMCKMNNFFCGLHFLVALADSCSATLCQWENLHTEKLCTAESGTLRLIRSACKAIQKQCSQNAGCHIMFKAYLETQGVEIFPISKFVGNRFNIVFYNAGGLYFLRNHLTSYLQEIHHTKNKLLQCVLNDLSNTVYVQGCRALGIINKCVTGPFWRILESQITMSELSRKYQQMKNLFLKWSYDATPLLAGCGLSETREDDEVCIELLRADEGDLMVKEILQMLCKSFCLVCERLLGDHLQGGIYDVNRKEAKKLDHDTAAMPKTNTCSERDFALLDRFVDS